MLIAKLLFIIGALAAQAWLFDEGDGDAARRSPAESDSSRNQVTYTIP